MIICGIVSKIAITRHLIGKPAIHALIEMRWLNVEQSETEGGGQGHNANLNPRECFQPSGHANGILFGPIGFKPGGVLRNSPEIRSCLALGVRRHEPALSSASAPENTRYKRRNILLHLSLTAQLSIHPL